MSLIEDAINLLSEHPATQEAVRDLASEHEVLKTKHDHANQKNEVLERQLDDIRALTKEPEAPIHAPLTEDEKQRRLAEVFAKIEARALPESPKE
jgi:uncharacterized protein (DUF3084 family)